ncbi:monooxygenase [Actinorhabdospora filicis]|uniref:Monooxygenase n=1 Tax=Actinorhabdospora filicis TaxID=1785913 RepID=A0A9W6SN99_9ACTN|nr:NAD(P)-binding domain-containing protein [Actinorhabdospora filicis]GLZ79017.1 monooxygenase [Actinorhabdospora filicis]
MSEGGFDAYGVDAAYDRGAAVCVIGAGMAGLLAVKNLREHGFTVDCYERETAVGGSWNWRNDRSPVYASTHLISSRPLTEFPDFPMPDDWPDYPHHSQVLGYLERYTDHFGLREHIWFGSEISRVEPTGDGRWDVIVKPVSGNAARRLRYAAVVLANGHNWDPRMPEYDGMHEFRGEIVHSSAYKEPSKVRGKRVLVVGAGNSGCDIAGEVALNAEETWHSSRRGYWFVPKYVFGKPGDQALAGLDWLPFGLRQKVSEIVLRKVVGDPARFGMKRPDFRLFGSHPIVNSHLMYHIGQGSIKPKPDIERFTEDEVVFADGTRAKPHTVIMATGYRTTFDFCDPELLGMTGPDDAPRLIAQMLSPKAQTLAVVGLVQANGSHFPLAHWQTVALAKWLRLRERDPQAARAFWAKAVPDAGRRYVHGHLNDTARHRLEVSHDVYLKALGDLIQELEGVK